MIEPRWKKGESGNPKGRPKNPMKPILDRILSKRRAREVSGMSPSAVNDIERTLLVLRLHEIQALVKDEETPMYVKTLGMAMMSDAKNGKTYTIDRLRERQYGKEVTRVELCADMSLRPTPFEQLLIDTGTVRADDDKKISE